MCILCGGFCYHFEQYSEVGNPLPDIKALLITFHITPASLDSIFFE
jgi:hypothetical protein